jgi:hypothetical protein
MSVHTCRQFIHRGRKPMPLDKRIPDRLPKPYPIVLNAQDLDGKITEAEAILAQATGRLAQIKTNADYDTVHAVIDSARGLIKRLTAQRQAIELAKAAQAQPVTA